MKVETVTRHVCPYCKDEFGTKSSAEWCMKECARLATANIMLTQGRSLAEIFEAVDYRYSELTEGAQLATKDSCYTISYLQCCDYPAYRIFGIEKGFKPRVGGCGGHTGYYGSTIRWGCLNDPRPKEELYIHPAFRVED